MRSGLHAAQRPYSHFRSAAANGSAWHLHVLILNGMLQLIDGDSEVCRLFLDSIAEFRTGFGRIQKIKES